MSATNMTLFLLLGFSLLLHHEIEGITTHSVTGCSDYVPLNCSIAEMIHVERITFYNGTDCNQAVTDLQVCGQPVTGSDTGLSPVCNGKTSCNENIHYNTCPDSKAAKLNYRCIPRNDVKDICYMFMIKHIDRIFLSTPNYPLSPNFTDISSCRCSIRGSSITSIQLLELILQTSNDGTKSSLEIKYGDDTYKTARLLFNKRLSTASTKAEITLHHASSNKHYLWIEVQGVSLYVSCHIGRTSTPTTTTSPSPTPDSTSQTADIKSQSQGKYTTINIILGVLLCLCLLALCIAATIIIVLLCQNKSNKMMEGTRLEEQNKPILSEPDEPPQDSASDGTQQNLE